MLLRHLLAGFCQLGIWLRLWAMVCTLEFVYQLFQLLRVDDRPVIIIFYHARVVVLILEIIVSWVVVMFPILERWHLLLFTLIFYFESSFGEVVLVGVIAPNRDGIQVLRIDTLFVLFPVLFLPRYYSLILSSRACLLLRVLPFLVQFFIVFLYFFDVIINGYLGHNLVNWTDVLLPLIYTHASDEFLDLWVDFILKFLESRTVSAPGNAPKLLLVFRQVEAELF